MNEQTSGNLEYNASAKLFLNVNLRLLYRNSAETNLTLNILIIGNSFLRNTFELL